MQINTQPTERLVHESSYLYVHEVWRTIQGEGPHAGRPAVFVRLSGCNLCCPLCDTDYTSVNKLMSVSDLRLEILTKAQKGDLVVFTGGEPLRQNIGPIVHSLLGLVDIQIETNGSVFLEDFPYHLITVVCSPKVPKIHPKLKGRIHAWKYVLKAGEVSEEDGLPTKCLGYDFPPARRPEFDKDDIFVQPCDEQDEEMNRLNQEATVTTCMKYGYRFALQVHKIIGLP